jgi:hypothetical protein
VALYVALNVGQPSSHLEGSTGVLIDQLSSSYPNSTFWLTINSLFHESGLQLTYYQGSEFSDTVEFYKTLPQRGFRIIILRAHTAMDPETQTLALFTSEVWDNNKASTTYLADALTSRIARVRVTENSTPYFGITPDFVRAMSGNFQGAIIVMMGCDGLKNSKMAQAFIEKGAKAYVGWNGPVSTDHTDTATQLLLTRLITEKENIGNAVAETMNEVGKDPTYESIMVYYPPQLEG